MIMRVLLLLLFMSFSLLMSGQSIPLDQYTIDTIYLKDFTVKKIVSYKFRDVTFFVSYEDYKKELTIYWKRYTESMKRTAKSKQRGEYINPDYEPRYKLIDSVYQILKKESKSKDTIFLTHQIFDRVGLGSMNNFFPDLIEKSRCTIINNNNEKQSIIIRQKGSWYRGPLAAWGGRRYFLPGSQQFFISATDWVS